MAAKIIRLWGTADNFDIEFDRDTVTGLWETQIPADLEDGHYVVELFAMNEYGETGYWTGVLFMLQGRPHIHIQPPRYVIWCRSESSIEMLPHTWSISEQKKSSVNLLPPNLSISLIKRCNNAIRA